MAMRLVGLRVVLAKIPHRFNYAVNGNRRGQLENSIKHGGHNFPADIFLLAEEGNHLNICLQIYIG